jgi:GGDEF domain-containing protein/CBS domain-containing protein
MTVIAEGIESEDELHALHRLGVALGQGFLLARPSREMDAGIKSMPYQLKPSPWSEVDLEFHGGTGRSGDIAEPAPTLTGGVRLSWALLLFEDRRSSEVAVVVENGIPVGLLMRDKLTQERARSFGESTFATRTVAHLMSEQPLVVDCDAHLDAVSRMATARDDDDRYDDITVVRDGKLVGTVSVRRLLDAVTDARLSSANHANPLSGLPGHPVIEDWVRTRLRNRENGSLLHIDIDDLREFNQAYGFHQGDRAIRIAADLIASELAACSGGHSQLGHVGGDNFMAVADLACAAELVETLPQKFRDRVSTLYHPEDRARGFLQRQSAHGETVRVPLMSLTIARIHISSGSRQHYAELLDILADAMELARAASRNTREAILCVPPAQQLERRGTRAAPLPSPNAA